MPIGGATRGDTSVAVRVGTFCYVAHANDPGESVGDYLECNGQNVSRTTYANLFASIGIAWGAGDGVTTFTLPDARRRAPVGKGGAGTATLGNAVGNTGGEETHTLVIGAIPAHDHAGIGQVLIADGGPGNIGIVVGSTNTSGGNTPMAQQMYPVSNGGGSAHNNVAPSYICGVWIKT